MINHPYVHTSWKDTGFAQSAQSAWACEQGGCCGTPSSQQLPGREGNSGHIKKQKGGILKGGPCPTPVLFWPDSPIHSKCSNSPALKSRSCALSFCALCQPSPEHAPKSRFSSLHKRVWTKQSWDETGHRL